MSEVRDAAVTLSNSIIGVAILAMPYCYAQCGFILATALLLLAGLATSQSCQMLLKSALATKKRSYEFLAQHVYGPLGKLAMELSLIGLSIGTLVAFFVIIGDLCPQVLASLLRIPSMAESPVCRTVVMATIGSCVILPLSLMREHSVLSKISAASLLFYFFFLLHLASLALFSGGAAATATAANSNRVDRGVEMVAAREYRFFRLDGMLYCLPIFGLAFSCQTQLFLLHDSLRDPSMKVMKQILHLSVFGCCTFYILIGSLGYVTFNAAFPSIHGDLITMYPGTAMSDLIKLGFVLSVAVSFPIITFPCRVSIYSFVYLQQHRPSSSPSDLASGRVFIPDGKFRGITSVIVFGTLVGGLLIPNVEFVLGLTGAVTGSIICYILPAGIYLRAFASGSPGRWAARAIKWLGVVTLFVSTAATLLGQQQHQADVGRLPPPHRLQLPPSTPLAPSMSTPSPPPVITAAAAAAAALPIRDSADDSSRKEPPLPLPVIVGNGHQEVKKSKMMKARINKKQKLVTMELLKKGGAARSSTTSTTTTLLASSKKSTSTSTLLPSLTTRSISSPTNASAAAAAAAVGGGGANLEMLAQLLREQRQQGERIEAQLRRIAGGGGKDDAADGSRVGGNRQLSNATVANARNSQSLPSSTPASSSSLPSSPSSSSNASAAAGS